MATRRKTTKIDLKVNKIDRETFDNLSAEQISPKELWFITSADSVVVELDKYVTSAWVAAYVSAQIDQAFSGDGD